MGALIISDLHAHAWTRFATTRSDGVNSRFADLLDVLAQVDHYVEEHETEDLIILGDLTHQRGRVQFGVYTPLCVWIEKHAQLRNVVAVVGNHDIESRGYSSLGPLAMMSVTVVDEPRSVKLSTGVVRFVPYSSDGAAIVQAARAPFGKRGNLSTIFMHYALNGHLTGTEYAIPSALRLDDLEDFERIVFGHIHAPSIEQDGRVTYVGAPLHFDFGDVGARYCWLMTDDAMTKLPLYAPQFASSSYPSIPQPSERSGFLRVLDTPVNLSRDVQRAAREAGWLDCMTSHANVPREAMVTLSSSIAVMNSEALVREYVEQHYGSLSVAARESMVEFGLECLRKVAEQQ